MTIDLCIPYAEENMWYTEVCDTEVIVLCLAAVALARPQSERDAQIILYDHELREDQSWDTAYETSNGIAVEDSGIQYPGAEPETGNQVKSGSFEFKHPDGTITYLSYISDEDGYRPESDAIPTFNGRVDIQDAYQ
ncbi:Larval cuticle protein LCP-22 [Amphibalanus amphitrite]|uniref:Larval cuticle protein LCP-22 n=1 Tax=Amphibalanus amphitrite TaxID=1232801 RepID=A0A6A4W4Z3_AMPAM|nr:Larval cuticle protein LCP-22 [Amphibalanus amphitrite]